MDDTTQLTPKKGEKLLRRLALGKSVSDACRFQGISRQTYYDWYHADPTFKSAADQAIEEGTDKLEDFALKRAMSGESDTLTIFLLKGRRPDKFKDRSEQHHTGDLTSTVHLVGISEEDV
jgi:hypothetical protein